MSKAVRLSIIVLFCFGGGGVGADHRDLKPDDIRSVASGNWSEGATWSGGQIPKAGVRVYIARDHEVTYDVDSADVIRSIHLDGVLRFADDRTTRLETGLIRVGADGSTDESGFDCAMSHSAPEEPSSAALIVGMPDKPLDARHHALIRLHYLEGMDKDSCPSIVCCGGRMEFHGAPMGRTWLKLASTAAATTTIVELQEDPQGWRVGDRIILTATTRQNKIKKTFKPSTRDSTQTEERIIAAIDGVKITLDKPLEFEHHAEGEYRGDVANLSRNVVVESADPNGVRGHTMFHKHSSGSISYAEFRHLGKEGMLGRYSLHFHILGDSMRGASVVGASIWDSHNRWITIHGTDYLVVRDCVGYQSRGHGFFLEDGTETSNVLDRNLAVQASISKPLPKQVLPYDKNDGSGFWWANCHNTFTRNCAADCDEYGYFFQATKTPEFDPILNVRQADGSMKPTDIRTLPFVRFEDNEAHCQRRHSFNLGGGVPFGPPNVGGVGPDVNHPFIVRNLKLWNVHWGIHPVSPSVILDGIDIHNAEYGIWRPEYQNHAYRRVRFDEVPEKNYFAFSATNRPPNDEAEYPKPLAPVDDLPPATIITAAIRATDGSLVIRGTTTDDGDVRAVLVNGQAAKAVRPNFAEWEITLKDVSQGPVELKANATDSAGNVEQTPHELLTRPKNTSKPNGNGTLH